MLRSRFVPVLCALAILAVAPAARAADYALDVVEQSNIHFSMHVMAVSKITGKFMKYDLALGAGDKPDLSRASAIAVIETASIDTGNDSWDAKLSPGLVRRREVPGDPVRELPGAEGRRPLGSCRPHPLDGVTKEITLPFRFEGRFEVRTDEHIGIHATLKFDRRDYGMAWADNAEANVVGHIVTVEITILAKRVASLSSQEEVATGERSRERS